MKGCLDVPSSFLPYPSSPCRGSYPPRLSEKLHEITMIIIIILLSIFIINLLTVIFIVKHLLKIELLKNIFK